MVSNAESLDYTSRARSIRRGEIAVLRNVDGFYAAMHVIDIKDDKSKRRQGRTSVPIRHSVKWF